MQKTIVKVECVKKTEVPYSKENKTVQTQIELHVGYDRESIYFQQSGGTSINLITVNQEAADMFKVGESYDLTLSPSEKQA